DENNLRKMDQLSKDVISPLAGDPRVIGYYSDNEIGWWNGILWKMTLEQAPTSGQRQRLIGLLRETYRNDWTKLLQDFDAENAANWDELERGGMLWHKPGSNGIHTMRRFLALVADRYYHLMRDLVRKYDPDALYLGDRYQSFYYTDVARVGGAYVD